MGRPRSLTSDDVRKAEIQSQRSDIWSCSEVNYSCLHSSHWQQSTWLKTRFRWKMVGGGLIYNVITPWPDLIWSFFRQKLRKWCPISSAKFQRDPPSASAAITEKHSWGSRFHPPSLWRRGLRASLPCCLVSWIHLTKLSDPRVRVIILGILEEPAYRGILRGDFWTFNSA